MWDEMLGLNVKMPALLVTGLAKIMKREGVAGSMVLIGSVAHHGGNEVLWAYSASKHALETLVKNAAFSLMPENIRVNMLNPGWMDTPAEHDTQMRFHDAPQDWLVAAEAAQPTGRLLKTSRSRAGHLFLVFGRVWNDDRREHRLRSDDPWSWRPSSCQTCTRAL